MIKKLSLLTLTSLSLFATNGVNMIGTGAVSRSMGGTGVAFYSSGVEAMGKNPALMAHATKNEFEMSVTAFFASVDSQAVDPNPLNPSIMDKPVDSQINWEMTFLPGMGFVYKYDENLNLGFAMIGAAGMGVDYKDEPRLHQLQSRMMIMKMVPTISYSFDNFNLGIAPVIGLGSMTINYDSNMLDRQGGSIDYDSNGKIIAPSDAFQYQKNQSSKMGVFGTHMGGPDLIPSIGWQAGIDAKVNDKLRIGITYQSSMTYTYHHVANFEQFGYGGFVWMGEEFLQTYQHGNADTNVALRNNIAIPGVSQGGSTTLDSLANQKGDLGKALESLGLPASVAKTVAAAVPNNVIGKTEKEVLAIKNGGKVDNIEDDLTLEQPWELAVGFAYDPVKTMTITMDYRYIPWSGTKGYGEFGWSDQTVIALGAEVRKEAWKFRFGYNHADNPLAKVDPNEWGMGTVNIQGHTVFKQSLSMLNTVAFPAITTTHFTAGLGYAFSEDLTMNASVVYAPKVTYIAQGRLVPNLGQPDAKYGNIDASLPYAYKTSMTQLSFTYGMNYRF